MSDTVDSLIDFRQSAKDGTTNIRLLPVLIGNS